jgi:hypothetical protein
MVFIRRSRSGRRSKINVHPGRRRRTAYVGRTNERSCPDLKFKISKFKVSSFSPAHSLNRPYTMENCTNTVFNLPSPVLERRRVRYGNSLIRSYPLLQTEGLITALQIETHNATRDFASRAARHHSSFPSS